MIVRYMKEFFKNKIIIKKWWPYLVIFVITLLVGFPLIKSQVLNGHDAMFHLFRMNSLKVAQTDGQIIPLVNPNMFGGFGYASNMFYGVLTSYLVLILGVLTSTLGGAINLLVLLTIFLSGLFTYLFIKEVTNKKYVSLMAAIIYISFPYHLYDIYVRMSLGEIMAFVFIPILFHGIYNTLNGNQDKWYFITIGASGLMLTHNISTFMTAIFAFLYLILNMKKVLNGNVIKNLCKSLVWALFLSLITIVPIFEAKFSSDYMVFDNVYMNATGQNMVDSAINILGENSYLVNIVRISLVIGLILLVLYLVLKKRKKINSIYLSFLILLLISLILTLNVIPWTILPNIFAIFQFPWRFLQMTSFFIAIVIALFIDSCSFKRTKIMVLIIALICVCINIPLINMGIKNNGINNDMINYNRIKKRDNIARSTGTASAEYLPRKAIYNYDYLVKRDIVPLILKGTGEIKNIKKDGTKLNFKLISEEEVEVELPFIYYPGYLVKVNDKNTKTYETKNGLLGVVIGKGEFSVAVRYRGSNLTIGAYAISILSGIALILVIIKEKAKNHNKVET